LEAALCECTLVLGDIPSLREIWEDAAVFVSPRDSKTLRRVLQWLIKNPADRMRLGEAARARAMLFTPERMMNAYLALYENLLSGAVAPTPT
jgi:glycosyltransferase involved in cell wall biosynthesis